MAGGITGSDMGVPPTVRDLREFLETWRLDPGVDVNQWIRAIMSEGFRFAAKGSEIKPPTSTQFDQFGTGLGINTLNISGPIIPANEVHIIRMISFEEDTTSAAETFTLTEFSAIDRTASGRTATIVNVLNGGIFLNDFLIGADTVATQVVRSSLPLVMHGGGLLKINLTRPVAGELGGHLLVTGEKYDAPWRPSI